MPTFDPYIDDTAHQLIGQIDSVSVTEPGAPVSTAGNHVIDPSKPFDINLKWQVNGNLAPVFLAALADEWVVKVYAEAMGAGEDLFLAEERLAKGVIVLTNSYDMTSNVANPTAKGLREGNPGSNNSGVYKLIVTVFLDSGLGPVGYDISGFEEGPMIRVENPS